MNDNFFDYLVATDQLDKFLGGNSNESNVEDEELEDEDEDNAEM